MKHPTPQTQVELERECVGCIWRVADDIAKAAEQMDIPGMEIHFRFLKSQFERLELIRKSHMPTPRMPQYGAQGK